MTNKATSEKKAAFLKWMKKVGVWGFLFFLVKGLIWLAVGYWALK
ncbi:alanyl-tRNA synthetase [Pedobacter ginsengisoli]|uniref:Alanyl-tRNA synthetase n=1 Tax=Pedobacter ginsengisoli TaxID=363852 RepID=A0A2D1U2R5_9SPHI|nr:alanyl-tRNA synthetase [Pedobacter ginsengisoli]